MEKGKIMNYHGLTYPDQNNGDGLRVVLWLSGCSHHCKECQNPQTWNPDSGILFDDLAEEELFRELNKDYISGITFTGGDPLHEENLDDVLRLINRIRLLCPDKTIWLYTGYSWSDVMDYQDVADTNNEDSKFYADLIEGLNMLGRKEIIKKCDVLVDGRYIHSQRDITLPWCGSANQKVIDVKQTLQKGEVILWKS